jgi:hypothetical protein
MWLKKIVAGILSLVFYFLMVSSLAHAVIPNEVAISELRSFIGIPSVKTYFKSSIRGVEALTYQSCNASLEVDPKGIRVKIEKEKSAALISPMIIEIPLSGVSSLGHRVDVTQMVKFPTDLLVAVDYERGSGSKTKGDMTLLIHRESEGTVNLLSISEGESRVSCVKPESLMFDTAVEIREPVY